MRRSSLFLILFFLVLSQLTIAQNEKAFIIYNSKGKKSSYKKMLAKAKENEIIFFGEFHDNPISHWLQFELTEDMHQHVGSNLRLGFEMFEQDQQWLLNDYLIGKIDDKGFKDSARLWPNYKTDYYPLINFAKQNNLFCLASNVPRRYASLLFKKGREALKALPEADKAYMAPVDFVVDSTLSQYKALLGPEMHMGGFTMMEAQAFKDATMAHFMLLNKTKDHVYIHFNGAYHSDYYQGIMWYVQQKHPDALIMTISTVTQSDIKKLDKEHFGKADFIICVPETMTSTH